MVVSTTDNVKVSLTARCERDGEISEATTRKQQIVSPTPSGRQHHVTGRITERLTPKTIYCRQSHSGFIYRTFLLTFSH